MTSPFSEFASGINNTVDTYRANPAPLQQEVRRNANKPLVDQSLVRLIAASMLNEEQKNKMQELNRALNPRQGTVAEQTFADATAGKEQEVAMRVGLVNAQKAQEQRKRMNQMGIGGLPTSMNQRPPQQLAQQRTQPQQQQRPTMQAAGGGLIAFAEGSGPEAITSDVAADDTSYVEVGLDKAQEALQAIYDNPATAISGAALTVLGLRTKAAKDVAGWAKDKVVKLPKKVWDEVTTAFSRKPKLKPDFGDDVTSQNFARADIARGKRISDARSNVTKATLGASAVPAGLEIASNIMGGGEEEGEETGTDTTGVNTGVTTGAEEEKDAGIPTTPDFDERIQDALTKKTTATDALLTGITSINPDLSVSAIKQSGDAARAAKQQRTDEIIEKLREGKATLGTQIDKGMTKRYEAFKQLQDRADMLAGRGEYAKAARTKEFLRALAGIGQGGNLGQALGDAYGNIVTQEEVRNLRGAEADREIAAFQAETADKLIQNAKDMFGLESEIAFKAEEYLSDIDRMDADTAAKMLQAQALDTEFQKLKTSMQQSNIQAGFEADLQKIQAAVDLFKVAATRDINLRQQDVELLKDYNSGINDLVIAVNSQLTEEEDKKKLLNELTRIQGIVDTLTKSLNLTK